MITLRDYQNELATKIRNAFRTGKKAPMAVAPTGAGKTVLFSYIARGASEKGNNVMILLHRQELVDQTCRTLRTFGVDHGVIAAGRSPDRTHLVQVASVQTLLRRLQHYKPDLIIIDECHHAVAGSWRKIIAAYPSARILGTTATPERVDGKGLGEVFDDLIMGPEVSWLIEQGHLSRPKYYAPPNDLDLLGVHRNGNDYNRKELAAAMAKASITGDAIKHYSTICPGMPAVAFCVSIKDCEEVAAKFNAAGFRWRVLDGNMDKDERRLVVQMLGDGRLDGICSCEIVNEGFDLPIVTVAILLRPTASLGLHLQQIGRVLRPSPGKTHAIILDHVGNTGAMKGGVWVPKHGFAEEERQWSLEGRVKKKKRKAEEEEDVQVRQCLQCFCCHTPAPVCPECGFVYPIKERKIEILEGELVQLDAEALKRQRRAEQAKAETLEELVAYGRSRGYNNPLGWAKHVLHARQGKRGGYSSQM